MSTDEDENKTVDGDDTVFAARDGLQDAAPDEAPSTPGRGGAGVFFDSKSIRLHTRGGGGLAARLATPIIVVFLLTLLLFSFVVRRRVSSLRLEDLKAAATNAAFINGQLGRLLITHRAKFLADNPGYISAPEWKTGEHWLAAHGFVSAPDWIAATGFQLDEYAPVPELEKAEQRTALSGSARNLDAGPANAEMVAAFIVADDGRVVASTRKTGFPLNPLALQAVPLPEAYVDAGGCRIYVDYIGDLDPEPVVRGVARIMDGDNPEKEIGAAFIVLRTTRHASDQTAFSLLLAGMGLFLALVMAAVCWYSARRVTSPMRRLASDMQAMAEGDYTRRSAIGETGEIGLLAQTFNAMVERLRVARLNEMETNRIESDLAIARQIQNNLLPPQTPRVRGLDIHTSYRPAREIGGDYYDFLPVDERHMGVVVADASGKSIPAALVMSTTRAILRFVAPGSGSAAETLASVNAILSVDIPKGMFVSAYYLILDPMDNSMLCASAGHTPLLLGRSDGSVEAVNPGGIAMGFDPGPIFQRSIRERRVRLEKGDRVLLYTDGVVECVNPANEEYSDRRLREFLRRNRELPSHDFVGALLADLDRHRGTADIRDDTTIVTFRVI